jgi:phage baseplate assembly protein gpV
MNKQVTLTEAEARIVMQALDIATKAGGLNAASQLLPVAVSIEKQLTESGAEAGSQS